MVNGIIRRGRTIGEVCLQWMNIERGKVPGEKVMRLPIGIWDKSLWGKGYGREVVQVLMAYAFEQLEIDRFCPVDVGIDNMRSQALWKSVGLSVARRVNDRAIQEWTAVMVDLGNGSWTDVRYQVSEPAGTHAIYIRISGNHIDHNVKLDSKLVPCEPVYETVVANAVGER